MTLRIDGMMPLGRLHPWFKRGYEEWFVELVADPEALASTTLPSMETDQSCNFVLPTLVMSCALTGVGAVLPRTASTLRRIIKSSLGNQVTVLQAMCSVLATLGIPVAIYFMSERALPALVFHLRRSPAVRTS